jgi:hypothetical protein
MRSKSMFAMGFAVVTLSLAALFLGACASGGSSSGTQASSGSSEPAKTAPPKGVAPPAGSKMAKLQLKMTPEQVTEIMGSPTGQKSYMTGKAFNPFNYGNDSGSRMEYAYKGEGRVVFAVPRWGGSMKVVRIDYDPAEDGN